MIQQITKKRALDISFPVFVQWRETGNYIVKPLFCNDFVQTGDKLETLFESLNKAVRDFFNVHDIDDNFMKLKWITFYPSDLKIEKVKLEFHLGKMEFSEHFSLVSFTFENIKFGMFPAFDNHFFILNNNKEVFSEQLAIQLNFDSLVRSRLKILKTKTEIDLQQYISTKADRIISSDASIEITSKKLEKKEKDEKSKFLVSFNQFFQFNGAQEIHNVGYSLNDLFPNRLMPFYFKEDSVKRVYDLVYGADNIPIAIIGKRGIGKTTLVHQIVKQYLEECKTAFLKETLDNVWLIDPMRIISGMAYIGQWQSRLEEILNFIAKPLKYYHLPEKSTEKTNKRKDKILVENPVAMMRIGKSSQNNLTIADMLKPYIERQKIQIIIQATEEEWGAMREINRSFTDLFSVVRMQEYSNAELYQICCYKRSELEYNYNFRIENHALRVFFELNKSLATDYAEVGLICNNLIKLAIKSTNATVNAETIIDDFVQISNINPKIFDKNIRLSRREIVEELQKTLVGQSDALNTLTDLVLTIKAKMSNPEKPLGVFLFIGPTGVGKTQAAKALAKYLFVHEDALLRFDMNEYLDDGAVNRLIGGYDNPDGQLTSKVLKNPSCVLLLDEIEKAHPLIFNLLLQVLGEGRLTDTLGRVVNFSRTVIIMTSNLGAAEVGKIINFKKTNEVESAAYLKSVQNNFRPEFVNRIDKIVIFKKLVKLEIEKIAGMVLSEFVNREGFVRKNYIINISEPVRDFLVELGYDYQLGGRAIKRTIEKELTALIADLLIEVNPKNSLVVDIFIKNNKLLPTITELEFCTKKYNIPKEPQFTRKDNKELIEEFFTQIKNLKKISTAFFKRNNLNLNELNDVLSKFKDLAQGSFEWISGDEYHKELEKYDKRIQLVYNLNELLKETESHISTFTYYLENYMKIEELRKYMRTPTESINRKDFDSYINQGKILDSQILDGLSEIEDIQDFVRFQIPNFFSENRFKINIIRQCLTILTEKESDTLLLVLNSASNDQTVELEYVTSFYTGFFVNYPLYQDKNQKIFKLVGHGIAKFFEDENGYHLFNRPYKIPVLIKLSTVSVSDEITNDAARFKKLVDNTIHSNLNKDTSVIHEKDRILRSYTGNYNYNDNYLNSLHPEGGNLLLYMIDVFQQGKFTDLHTNTEYSMQLADINNLSETGVTMYFYNKFKLM